MIPACFPLDEIGIEQIPAIIVDTGDEIPFRLGQRSPEMMGRVMLDEFSDIVGQDLTVMGFSFGPTRVKVILFGPLNNGRDTDPLSVLIPEEIADIGVVISVELNFGVFNHRFLYPQLSKDVPFDLGADFPSGFLFLINDREL